MFGFGPRSQKGLPFGAALHGRHRNGEPSYDARLTGSSAQGQPRSPRLGAAAPCWQPAGLGSSKIAQGGKDGACGGGWRTENCCCPPPTAAEGALQGGVAALPEGWLQWHLLLQDDALLDDIIDRLLDVRTGRPGKQVALSETEVSRGWHLQCSQVRRKYCRGRAEACKPVSTCECAVAWSVPCCVWVAI